MTNFDITDWLMEQNDEEFAVRRENLFKMFDNDYGQCLMYASTYNIAYDLLCEEANLSPTTCKSINNLIALWQKEKNENNYYIDVYSGKYKLHLGSLPTAIKFYVFLKSNNKIHRQNIPRSALEEEFREFEENPQMRSFSSVLFAMTFLGLARVYHRNSVKVYYNNNFFL